MEYSCFNSEFSNGIFQPKEDQESFNMKEKGKGKKNEAKLCCCTKNTKNASLNFFFFFPSWSTFCMTHEPGSKMAS